MHLFVTLNVLHAILHVGQESEGARITIQTARNLVQWSREQTGMGDKSHPRYLEDPLGMCNWVIF